MQATLDAVESERRRRDEEAVSADEYNKDTLDQIKEALVQNNKNAEEVKKANISAVNTKFETESSKINQTLAEAMKTLVKSDDIDKVKDEV